MRDEVKNRARAAIFQKKRAAEAEFEKKMQPVRADAEFLALEKEVAKLSIEVARAEVYGQEKDGKNSPLSTNENFDEIQQKREKIKKNQEKMQKIMQKNGIFEFEPNFSCKICKDEGVVFGKDCVCMKREMSKILLQESGFDALENFEDSIKTADELVPLYKLMQKWTKSDFKKNLVFLSGPVGVGKTHLLRCMANEFIEKGMFVKITSAFEMNLQFKNFAKTHNEEILQKYLSPEVLFVDDLGAEPCFKNVTQEYLYLIVNERKMQKKITVITSNLSLADVRDRYEERVFSRIADRGGSITLFVEGRDRRING